MTGADQSGRRIPREFRGLVMATSLLGGVLVFGTAMWFLAPEGPDKVRQGRLLQIGGIMFGCMVMLFLTMAWIARDRDTSEVEA